MSDKKEINRQKLNDLVHSIRLRAAVAETPPVLGWSEWLTMIGNQIERCL
jgi:hypothetical protein